MLFFIIIIDVVQQAATAIHAEKNVVVRAMHGGIGEQLDGRDYKGQLDLLLQLCCNIYYMIM